MLHVFFKGKTSLLYTLKGSNKTSSPAVGFNVETVEPIEGVFFGLHDVVGTERSRKVWIHHIENAKGDYSIN